MLRPIEESLLKLIPRSGTISANFLVASMGGGEGAPSRATLYRALSGLDAARLIRRRSSVTRSGTKAHDVELTADGRAALGELTQGSAPPPRWTKAQEASSRALALAARDGWTVLDRRTPQAERWRTLRSHLVQRTLLPEAQARLLASTATIPMPRRDGNGMDLVALSPPFPYTLLVRDVDAPGGRRQEVRLVIDATRTAAHVLEQLRALPPWLTNADRLDIELLLGPRVDLPVLLRAVDEWAFNPRGKRNYRLRQPALAVAVYAHGADAHAPDDARGSDRLLYFLPSRPLEPGRQLRWNTERADVW